MEWIVVTVAIIAMIVLLLYGPCLVPQGSGIGTVDVDSGTFETGTFNRDGADGKAIPEPWWADVTSSRAAGPTSKTPFSRAGCDGASRSRAGAGPDPDHATCRVPADHAAQAPAPPAGCGPAPRAAAPSPRLQALPAPRATVAVPPHLTRSGTPRRQSSCALPSALPGPRRARAPLLGGALQ
ncbi:unnamed protein product [Rangifer tarandus platyrhynchus]|uniref:Uncharacterized protein n=1 Tax=Rangifer tarandus platyrhynchus TaxID=3082113 RepID=A0ABN9A5U3_RANTA|nr:unnamed protein product [Rangifer tarandus platyrhynchus]